MSCWSGIKSSDGSRCQISAPHKVLIYEGRTMIGGKFYEADAHGIRILLSKWLSKDEMWALMKGRLELLKLEDFDTVRELADGLIGLLEGIKK